MPTEPPVSHETHVHPMPTEPPVSHETHVHWTRESCWAFHETHAHWTRESCWAFCDCGWCGTLHVRQRWAEQDAEEHLYEMDRTNG